MRILAERVEVTNSLLLSEILAAEMRSFMERRLMQGSGGILWVGLSILAEVVEMARKSMKLLFAVCILCDLVLAQGRLAITGGTMIDVRNGALVRDAVIVIEGDRIISVYSGERAPQGATVVDAKGKYILPGLIDLHVHYKDWAPELYLNHGVTTAVDLGSATEWIRLQREGIAKGTIPGPRLFIATRMEGPRESREAVLKSRPLERAYIDQISYVDQPPGQPEAGTHVVRNAAEAREAMKDYVSGKIKIDAIKPVHNLSEDALRGIVEEARKINIPLAGHFADARLAAEVGANGLEHTWAVAVAILDNEARAQALKKVTKGFLPPAESFMNLKRLPEIIKLMVDKGVYLNPTLRMTWAGDRALLEKEFHYQDFDLLHNNWLLRYIPLAFRLAAIKEDLEIDLWHWADLTQYDRDLFHQGYENAKRLVKAFVEAGGKLYAGTDCAEMCVPGLGMHQELELLVDAGITPLQALQAATVNPAELMRMQDRLGTIAEGKAADVLILDANPLENIRSTRKIAKVISRGRVLDGQYHPEFKNPVPNPQWESGGHYFPPPRIRQVSPASIVAGARGATLTIRGTGFIPYSLVLFNGEKLTTNFVDEFQLTAEVPAKLLTPGTFSVIVENPDYGSGRARGAPDLSQLEVLDHVSNAFLILVGPGVGNH